MKTAYLFPGQGSQYVGMGRDLYESFPEARLVFDQACEILHLDLKRICFEGPEEDLKLTHHTQPAIFIHSIAVLRVLGLVLEKEKSCAAGHSLGEYSAYVAARALSFSDALRLVRRRGQLMYQAGLEWKGAMAACLGLSSEEVEQALAKVKGTVRAANYNSPSQIVISGDAEAVGQAIEALKAIGAKKVLPLEVSGAFHSPLMEPAAKGLEEALATVPIETARCDVIANESATAVTEPTEIRHSLARQILAPVRWEQSVRTMLAWGAERFLELGPGRVLSGLVRAVDREAQVVPLGTADQLRAFQAESGGVP